MEATEPHITENTKAIVTRLDKLQNLESELREIRRLLEAEHEKKLNRWQAFKRAVNQFFSQT